MSLGYIKNNQYRLDNILGQGGMARVYLALDTKNCCRVAIKQTLIPETVTNKEKFLDRFRQEYDFLSAVDHPNIVRAHDFVEEKKQMFLVMEYVSGTSLQDIIVSKPHSLSLEQQLAIASQIAKGVEILNLAGILHRDIKPENILIDEEGKSAKIFDLGIGKLLGDNSTRLTHVGTTVGTPEYMSPEQISGEISVSTDVFSLGVTLYQFFSWQDISPFKSNTMISTMNDVVTKQLVPLCETIRTPQTAKERRVYRDLTTIFKKALEKNPLERLGSARELGEEIDRIYHSFLGSQQITFVDQGIPELGEAWLPGTQLDIKQLNQLDKLGRQYGKDVVFRTPDTIVAADIPPHMVAKKSKRQFFLDKMPRGKALVKIAAGIVLVIAILIMVWWKQPPTSDRVGEKKTHLKGSSPSLPSKETLRAERERLKERWPNWTVLAGEKEKLEAALILLSEYQNGREHPVKAKVLLDQLAQEYSETHEKADSRQLARFLFRKKKLQAHLYNDFCNPYNANLVYAIQQKRSFAIILVSVYMLVGHRLGIHIEGSSFPRRFFAKVYWNNQLFLVDWVDDGSFIRVKDIENKLTEKMQRALKTAPNAKSIVKRTLLTLIEVYEKKGNDEDLALMYDLLELMDN